MDEKSSNSNTRCTYELTDVGFGVAMDSDQQQNMYYQHRACIMDSWVCMQTQVQMSTGLCH